MQTNQAITPQASSLPTLYEQDFMLWIEATAQLLKEQKFTDYR